MTQNNTLTTTATPDLDTLAHRAPATNDLLQLADWLASHGAAHLSTIERIELAEHLITRRHFIIGAGGLLGAAALGACGAGGTESGTVGETTSGGTRTVEHALGMTEVPVNPQRIVLQHPIVVDAALMFGVDPVGIAIDQGESYPYIQQRLSEDDENVGEPPNIEAIATLEPDLIIGLDVSLEEIYDELSAIAPTVGVLFGDGSGDWQQVSRRVAETLGRTKQFGSQLAAYEERAEEIGRRLGVPGDAPTVALMLTYEEGGLVVFELPKKFSGSILYRDVGLPLPEGLREPTQAGEFVLEVSKEEFSRGDADVLFLFTAGRNAEQQIAAIRKEPVFQNLQAVESGNVYPVGAHWFSGSFFAANLILDDLERYLLGEGGA